MYLCFSVGDGNCLMHAASLAMWGYHDNSLFLRKLVYLALVEDTADVFKRRWVQEKEEQNKEIPNGGLHLNTGVSSTLALLHVMIKFLSRCASVF